MNGARNTNSQLAPLVLVLVSSLHGCQSRWCKDQQNPIFFPKLNFYVSLFGQFICRVATVRIFPESKPRGENQTAGKLEEEGKMERAAVRQWWLPSRPVVYTGVEDEQLRAGLIKSVSAIYAKWKSSPESLRQYSAGLRINRFTPDFFGYQLRRATRFW